jgi:hypothetical protein
LSFALRNQRDHHYDDEDEATLSSRRHAETINVSQGVEHVGKQAVVDKAVVD